MNLIEKEDWEKYTQQLWKRYCVRTRKRLVIKLNKKENQQNENKLLRLKRKKLDKKKNDYANASSLSADPVPSGSSKPLKLWK